MHGELPLQISALVKRFGTLTAVDGVSFDVQDRECLGLLGPNGAGKSTTIRSIVGRVRPDSGTVRIFDRDAGISYPFLGDGWYEYDLQAQPETTSTAGQYFVTQEELPDSADEFVAQDRRMLEELGVSPRAMRVVYRGDTFYLP